MIDTSNPEETEETEDYYIELYLNKEGNLETILDIELIEERILRKKIKKLYERL